MTLIQTRMVGAVLVALTPLLGTAIAHAAPADAPKGTIDPSDDNTRVRSSFRKAAAASEAGKYEEARQLLLDAWSIRQTYDVASSLAQVEIQLKRYRDAAEHLEFCIRNFAPVESEQTLAQAKKAFAEVRTRVAMVKVSTNHQGAEIFLDSLGIGTDPLPSVIFVEPGPHRLAARLAGDTAEQSLNAQAGQEYVAELKLNSHETTAAPPVTSEVTAVPPAVDPNASEPSKPEANRSLVPLIVGGAATAIGLGMFIGFRVSAKSDRDTVESLSAQHGDFGCAEAASRPSDCAAQREAGESYDRKRDWSTAGLVIAASSAVIGTAFYLLWPTSVVRSGASSPRKLRVDGAFGSGAASISVVGAF